MSWSAQIRPEEIRSIAAWRTESANDLFLTINVDGGGSITLTDDYGPVSPERVRKVLAAILTAWDAIDPAKGDQPRHEITSEAWAAEQAEAPALDPADKAQAAELHASARRLADDDDERAARIDAMFAAEPEAVV